MIDRIYVDAYGQYGLGHLIRSRTIAKSLGNYVESINRFFPKKADISVIDSYHCSYLDYLNISKLSKLSLFIDDYNRIKYPKGVLLNISFEAKKIVKQSKTLNLLGVDYVPIREEFLNRKRNLKHILIILGGVDFFNISLKIEKLNLPYQTLIVTTNQMIARNSKNVLLNPSVTQLAEAFANSILAISGAGMSLYELNYLGVPTIAIKIAKNQNGVYQFQKRGFIKDVFEKKFDLKLLQNSIYWHLNHYDLVLNRYTNRFIDGYGVKRIKNKILELL